MRYEWADSLESYVEHRRLSLRPREEDDLDFYQELYNILKEVPWGIWERLGFNRVSEVRIYPDMMNPTADMFPIHLRVWIYYNHTSKAELNGFERLDSPWADLALLWAPYREFLMKESWLGLSRMAWIRGEDEEKKEIPDEKIRGGLEIIPLVNDAYEENQLRRYIDGLNLYPVIVKECQRQKAEKIRDLRRIMVDVGVSEIIQMVEDDDEKSPLIRELRDFCEMAKRWRDDSSRDLLINFLLGSPKSIEELNQMADELIPKIRDEVSKTPGLLYLFDRLEAAGNIRSDTLRLKNLKRSGLESLMIEYLYKEYFLYDVESAFKMIIHKPENCTSREMVQDVIFPFAEIADDVWEGLQEAAEIYKAHKGKQLSDFEVSVENQEDGYIARIPLLEVQTGGRTQEDAMERLKEKYEKDHHEWITIYAVKTGFGGKNANCER